MKHHHLSVLAVVLFTAFAPARGQECAAVSESVQEPGSAPEIGARQNVTGSVSELNPLEGRITVESSVGLLELEFPPQALREFAPGDLVAIGYAIAKAGETPLQEEEDFPVADYQVAGRLGSVDYETGWVRVETDVTTLRLVFPPAAVRDLRVGERVTVTLALAQGS